MINYFADAARELLTQNLALLPSREKQHGC